MNELLKYILNDFAEPIKYLPYGIIAGIIIRVIIDLAEKFIYPKDSSAKKYTERILFFMDSLSDSYCYADIFFKRAGFTY